MFPQLRSCLFLATLCTACGPTTALPSSDPPLSLEVERVRVAAGAGGSTATASAAASGSAAVRARRRPARHACDAAVAPAPTRPPPAPPSSSCLFGQQFSELWSHPELVIVDERFIRTTAELESEREAQQLVIAVHQSSHVDVTSAVEALTRVDEGEVRRLVLHEIDGGRRFKALEYGAGDNSYGAIFAEQGLEVLASIRDGDLNDCRE